MEDVKVTREVIIDLLPLYESGEASAETQRLVKVFLENDRELSRLIGQIRQARIHVAADGPPAEVELKTLRQTRQLLRHQRSVMAVAVFFTLAPFVFTFDRSHVTFLMIRDAPIVGGTYLLTGIIMWIIYFVIRQRLRLK